MMKSSLSKITFITFSFGIIFGKNNQNVIPDLKLNMLDGEKKSIHELTKDGPLMIDFWATWCGPCKKIMKHLDQYHQDYKDQGFKVLMINQDPPRSIGKVKSFIRSQGYEFFVS